MSVAVVASNIDFSILENCFQSEIDWDFLLCRKYRLKRNFIWPKLLDLLESEPLPTYYDFDSPANLYTASLQMPNPFSQLTQHSVTESVSIPMTGVESQITTPASPQMVLPAGRTPHINMPLVTYSEKKPPAAIPYPRETPQTLLYSQNITPVAGSSEMAPRSQILTPRPSTTSRRKVDPSSTPRPIQIVTPVQSTLLQTLPDRPSTPRPSQPATPGQSTVFQSLLDDRPSTPIPSQPATPRPPTVFQTLPDRPSTPRPSQPVTPVQSTLFQTLPDRPSTPRPSQPSTPRQSTLFQTLPDRPSTPRPSQPATPRQSTVFQSLLDDRASTPRQSTLFQSLPDRPSTPRPSRRATTPLRTFKTFKKETRKTENSQFKIPTVPLQTSPPSTTKLPGLQTLEIPKRKKVLDLQPTSLQERFSRFKKPTSKSSEPFCNPFKKAMETESETKSLKDPQPSTSNGGSSTSLDFSKLISQESKALLKRKLQTFKIPRKNNSSDTPLKKELGEKSESADDSDILYINADDSDIEDNDLLDIQPPSPLIPSPALKKKLSFKKLKTIIESGPEKFTRIKFHRKV